MLVGVNHGSNRREQGIPETLIPIEIHLLRRAIWRYLNDTFEPNIDTYEALMAMDKILTLALNASMWGYFREEIAGQAEWDEAMERLIDSSAVGENA